MNFEILLDYAVSIIFWFPLMVRKRIRHLRIIFWAPSLDGKVVLITGASQGIGRALAHQLYRKGCRLILASRKVEALEELKQELLQSYDRSPIRIPVVIALDLSSHKTLAAKASEALEVYGKIDILVNNGGISQRSSVMDTHLDTLKHIMNVNLFGTVEFTRAILPAMIEAKRGQVVNILSVQSYIALPHRSGYSASKHALLAFSDSLRAEISQFGIKVGVISPGYVNTNLSKNALIGDGTNYCGVDKNTAEGYPPEEMAARIQESIQLEENEVVIAPAYPKLAIIVRFALPSVYAWVMARRASVVASKGKPIKKE